MSAGCGTFVSAALILVRPRLGIALFELAIGFFLIGCAVVARIRTRWISSGERKISTEKPCRSWFDRCDALMIVVVIVVQSALDPLLGQLRWSEGSRRIVPLLLLGLAILLKPRFVDIAKRRRIDHCKNSDADVGNCSTAEPWWQAKAGTRTKDEQTSERGKN